MKRPVLLRPLATLPAPKRAGLKRSGLTPSGTTRAGLRRAVLPAAVLALTGLLSACGGAGDTAAEPADSPGAPSAQVTGEATTGEAAAPSAELVTGEVTVYAPGALAAHTDLLADAYAEAYPGATASFETSHTPTQFEQLKEGSSTDVWIAANPKLMTQAGEEDLIEADTIAPVVTTELAIVTPTDDPDVTEMDDLTEDGVAVLLADDGLPIGMTMNAFFEAQDAREPGWSDKVKDNTVSRELGVKPIVTKIGEGEADAGIVFITDANDTVKTVEIPAEVNQTLDFQVAQNSAAANPEAAGQFVEFLSSDEGRQVLLDAGFLPTE